jgi:asparagine synthetase B (glutamine-hydrolysing)
MLFAALLKDGTTLLGREHTRKSLLKAFASGRSGRLRPDAQLGGWAGERFSEGGSEWQEDSDTPTGTEGRTALSAATYIDLKWYLPALLHVEDRTSMAFSLESRAPLLDYRLIEHAARVPSALKLKNLEMKHILRHAVKDLLPPVVYRRTDKKGMPTPIAPWFRDSLAPWVKEMLLEQTTISSGLLDEKYVRKAVSEHLSGAKDRSTDLWKMLSIETWWRVYIHGAGQLADKPIATARSAISVG